jgi:thiol-disulfide isomerase/thioredoxin
MMRIETYSRQPDLMLYANNFRVGDCFQLGLGGCRTCARETEPPRRRQFAVPQAGYVSSTGGLVPLGAAAFGRAKELNRPILLDVGAVWCPWCDLMDRDTYTNAATADYINRHFIAVKVDFDASPKLVAQLQRAQAILNLPAGLPLTSFITPDGKLYFGAGYLPSKHKGEKRSFQEAADEALARYAQKSKIDEESFQLEVEK